MISQLQNRIQNILYFLQRFQKTRRISSVSSFDVTVCFPIFINCIPSFLCFRHMYPILREQEKKRNFEQTMTVMAQFEYLSLPLFKFYVIHVPKSFQYAKPKFFVSRSYLKRSIFRFDPCVWESANTGTQRQNVRLARNVFSLKQTHDRRVINVSQRFPTFPFNTLGRDYWKEMSFAVEGERSRTGLEAVLIIRNERLILSVISILQGKI